MLILIFLLQCNNMEYAFIFKHIFFIAPLLGISFSDVTVYSEIEKEIRPEYNWPKYNHFGQISAIGFDNLGNLYIFHRGNRVWDSSTFSENNIFNHKDKGPIPNETIVVLDSSQGSLLKKTGANIFYLPHGLTIDNENNVWVTDVALHQVFKFLPIDLKKTENLGEANLTLGVRFEPGNDKVHFCKPTGVIIDKETKEFYISDGYCNSRIIKYDQFGNVLLTLGRSSVGFPRLDPYMLRLPHALALAQDKQTLYVADRENFRVLSYDFKSGKFKRSYAEELKSKVFSVAYSVSQGGLLFILINDNAVPKMVAVYKAESGSHIFSFSPETNFTNPHNLAVSQDGKYCYVVELNPYKVWKFNLDWDLISHSFSGHEKKNEKSPQKIQELVLAESKIDKVNNFEVSSSLLAVSLVMSVIIISFLILVLHYYKRRGNYKQYEMRRLILDDDEDGIRLT